MIVIGIDPGLKGGVAMLSTSYSNSVIDMPLLDEFFSSIDADKIRRFTSDAIRKSFDRIAYVEHAQAMPKQGVVSVFNYGVGFGKVLAALEIAGVKIKLVRPAVWKKALGLSKDKNASVEMAEKLYPSLTFRTPRGRLLDGRAEALLIAHYGMMQETEK